MRLLNISRASEGNAVVFGLGPSVPSDQLYSHYLKRVFDFTFALILAVPISLVVAILAIMLRLQTSQPFFGHIRIGANGKPFVCWKLRTMDIAAKEKLAAYLQANPQAALEWERDHKLENDPRVTRLGWFLRKTSLDELPQIWNVLRGDMSLVGPRPIVRSELGRYGRSGKHYLNGRPGVTGLWQTSGRNTISYHERVALDVAYRNSTTFFGDLRILISTINAVIKGSGC